MSPAPWRRSLVFAAAAGLVAAVVLILSLRAAATPFGPGELDLLLTARAMASGVFPPLWAGAVHPDAVGTWMGAFVLSPLLRLGVPDLVALKGLATLHFAVLAGVGTALAARIAGARAALAAGAVLAIGAPSIAAAHSRYLATTVEAASIELLLLWALVEWSRGGGRRWLAPLGIAIGSAVAFSLHAAWIAVLAIGVVARHQRRWLPWLLAPLVLAALPWLLVPEPLGPPGHTLTIKTLGPLQLLGLIGPADALELLRRAPFALALAEPDSTLRGLHVPLAVALLLALIGALGARRDGATTLTALYTLGVAAPLLLAGDLLGYPAAYRYYVPAIAGAAVLLGVGASRSWRATALVMLLAAPGILRVGEAANTELTRPEAAFFAGQHRLVFPRDALHTHALMLTPWVRDDELAGWLQGYGLHVGREFSRQAPTAKVEYEDGFVGIDGGVPQVVNRHWHKMRAPRWLDGAAWLGPEANAHFLLGVGLGVAEDGVLDAHDLELLDAPTVNTVHMARGVGSALGERAFWLQDRSPLVIEGDRTWTASERVAMAAGFAETSSGGDLFPDLTPPRDRRLAHPHPFAYADVGVSGRGWTPSGPR